MELFDLQVSANGAEGGYWGGRCQGPLVLGPKFLGRWRQGRYTCAIYGFVTSSSYPFGTFICIMDDS